jgi:hypothetical protein
VGRGRIAASFNRRAISVSQANPDEEVGEHCEVGAIEDTTTSLYARAKARINNKFIKYERNFLS